jgi:hypothetical protein
VDERERVLGHELARLVAGRAVDVGTGNCADEASGGSQIELGVPFGVALAEVEVAVDFSGPWSGAAAMAVHADPCSPASHACQPLLTLLPRILTPNR